MENLTHIPVLRFPEFSGEWESKKINEITSYVDYRGKTPEKSDSGIFLITARNIREGYIDYECSKEYIPVENYEEVMRRGKPLIGDVLITTEAPCGNIASIDKEGIALAQRVIKFRGKENIYNYFLKFYFLSDFFQKKLFEKATGGTVKGIKGSQLHKMIVKFPTLPEQQKVADFLTQIDNKINQLAKKKQLLERYKKGVMQQIFSQEIRFTDDDGREFPEWEEKKLGDIGENIIGLTYSPNDIDNENGIIVLRSSNIKNDIIKLDDLVKVNTNISDRLLIKKNDIVICTRNGSQRLIGKNIIIRDIDIPMTFGAFMSVFRSSQNEFVYHLFKTDSYNEQIQANLGARINQITNKNLNAFKFSFPCPEEQTKIANFLTALDEKIALVEKQLNGTKQYKKGLLQQLFI